MPIPPDLALAIVSLILQAITGSIQLGSKSKEIYRSADGALVEHLNLEAETKAFLLLTDIVIDDVGKNHSSDSLDPLGTALLNVCHQCKEVGNELLTALAGRKLGSKGKHRKLESLGQAFKHVWSKGKLEALSSNLKSCQAKFDTAMMVRIKQEISQEIRRTESRSTQILMAAFKSPEFSGEVASFIDRKPPIDPNQQFETSNASITNDAPLSNMNQFYLGVLSRLHSYQGPARLPSIADPHRDTFRWILEDGSPLMRWLQCEHGMFHIRGDVGSGKSVAMKMIHDRVIYHDLLSAWAEKLPLVVCSSFHDHLTVGSPSNWMNMLASLLSSALKQHSDLAAVVFPALQQDFLNGNGAIPSWSEQELEAAFRLLVKEHGISIRLCCFIDGFDALSNDQALSIRFFEELQRLSDFKVCLSSRHSAHFEDAFERSICLQMDNYILTDLSTLIEIEFVSHPRYRAFKEEHAKPTYHIHRTLIENLPGGFAWLIPMLSSLRQGLTDGDSPSALLSRLQKLPPRLEAQYKDMFSRIPPLYTRESARVFQILQNSYNPVSILQLSFLMEEPQVILAMDNKRMTHQEKQRRYDQMQRYVSSRCNGLLIIASSAQPSYNGSEDMNCHHELYKSGTPGPSRSQSSEPCIHDEKTQILPKNSLNSEKPKRLASAVALAPADDAAIDPRQYVAFLLSKRLQWTLSFHDVTLLKDVLPTGVVFDHNSATGLPPQAEKVIKSVLSDLNRGLQQELSSRDTQRPGPIGSHQWRVYDVEQVIRLDHSKMYGHSLQSQRETFESDTSYEYKRMLRINKVSGRVVLAAGNDDQINESGEARYEPNFPIRTEIPKSRDVSSSAASHEGVTDLRVILCRESLEDFFSNVNAPPSTEGTIYTASTQQMIRDSQSTYHALRSPWPEFMHGASSSCRILDRIPEHTLQYQSCYPAYLRYRHPYVRDLFLQSEPASKFDSPTELSKVHRSLFLSCLGLLKTASMSRPERDRVVMECLGHAATIEACTGRSPTILLDHLDMVCADLFGSTSDTNQDVIRRAPQILDERTRPGRQPRRRRHKKPHWASTVGNCSRGANFISLAIQSHLIDYVGAKLALPHNLVDAADCSLLLYTITEQLPFQILGGQPVPPKPDVEMARLLLIRKANPYHGEDGCTPWDHLVTQASLQASSMTKTGKRPSKDDAAAEHAHSERMKQWALMVEIFLDKSAHRPRFQSSSHVADTVRSIFDRWNPDRARNLARLVKKRAGMLNMILHHPDHLLSRGSLRGR